MSSDPFGNGAQDAAPRRRGIGMGGMRLWILLAFAGYAAYYWFSNQTVDPYTGEKAIIDKNLSVEDEEALGLQAYEEILSQERPIDPNSQIAKQVRDIAQRLIAKTDDVEGALAAEHGQQPQYISRGFEWDVNVIESEQANAFCLPGGKMAVYTGLVPVAQNADAMAVVMGHEIAHALLRHGAQRMAQQKVGQIVQMGGAMSGMDASQQQMVMAAMGYGVLLPYARSHETQADYVGLMLAAAACFNPQEAVPLWERMSRAGRWQRTAGIRIHPSQPRDPHPEPAGADAEGNGIPAEILQPGHRSRRRSVNDEAIKKRAEWPVFRLRQSDSQALMNRPPLTGRLAPVMKPASSAVRNSTVRAISLGLPRRPTGTLSTIFARISSGTCITIAVSQ